MSQFLWNQWIDFIIKTVGIYNKNLVVGKMFVTLLKFWLSSENQVDIEVDMCYKNHNMSCLFSQSKHMHLCDIKIIIILFMKLDFKKKRNHLYQNKFEIKMMS